MSELSLRELDAQFSELLPEREALGCVKLAFPGHNFHPHHQHHCEPRPCDDNTWYGNDGHHCGHGGHGHGHGHGHGGHDRGDGGGDYGDGGGDYGDGGRDYGDYGDGGHCGHGGHGGHGGYDNGNVRNLLSHV
jgi:hypothetical protein